MQKYVKMKINKRKFEFIVYPLVIVTGVLSLIFDFTSNTTLAWILITLGTLNLIANLFRRKK